MLQHAVAAYYAVRSMFRCFLFVDFASLSLLSFPVNFDMSNLSLVHPCVCMMQVLCSFIGRTKICSLFIFVFEILQLANDAGQNSGANDSLLIRGSLL